jgi:hypothetical protein
MGKPSEYAAPVFRLIFQAGSLLHKHLQSKSTNTVMWRDQAMCSHSLAEWLRSPLLPTLHLLYFCSSRASASSHGSETNSRYGFSVSVRSSPLAMGSAEFCSTRNLDSCPVSLVFAAFLFPGSCCSGRVPCLACSYACSDADASFSGNPIQ